MSSETASFRLSEHFFKTAFSNCYIILWRQPSPMKSHQLLGTCCKSVLLLLLFLSLRRSGVLRLEIWVSTRYDLAGWTQVVRFSKFSLVWKEEIPFLCAGIRGKLHGFIDTFVFLFLISTVRWSYFRLSVLSDCF